MRNKWKTKSDFCGPNLLFSGHFRDHQDDGSGDHRNVSFGLHSRDRGRHRKSFPPGGSSEQIKRAVAMNVSFVTFWLSRCGGCFETIQLMINDGKVLLGSVLKVSSSNKNLTTRQQGVADWKSIWLDLLFFHSVAA